MEFQKFSLNAQARMLAAGLSKDVKIAAGQRKLVGERLAEIFAEITALLEPDVVLEIGAHEASYSQRIKSMMPSARVVAFEPHPVVRDKYSKTVLASGVEYLPLCVSDKVGETNLKVPMRKDRAGQEKLTMGSLLLDTNASDYAEYIVDTVTVDDFLGPSKGQSAVLWIDVEGGIGPVLQGAHRSLDRILAIYAEVEARARWEGQIIDAEVHDYLGRYGFVPVLRDIQRRSYGMEWQYNVIFIRKDVIENTKWTVRPLEEN